MIGEGMSDKVDSVHELLADHPNEMRAWLADVTQSFEGWGISEAAIAYMEREGRYLSAHEKTAVGFVAGILLDVVLHMQKYARPSDAYHNVYNSAVSAYRNHHYSQASGLHPMVISQIEIAIQHLKSSADAR
jgi:hypothetical protein